MPFERMEGFLKGTGDSQWCSPGLFLGVAKINMMIHDRVKFSDVSFKTKQSVGGIELNIILVLFKCCSNSDEKTTR